jgi:hypothetical protein
MMWKDAGITKSVGFILSFQEVMKKAMKILRTAAFWVEVLTQNTQQKYQHNSEYKAGVPI